MAVNYNGGDLSHAQSLVTGSGSLPKTDSQEPAAADPILLFGQALEGKGGASENPDTGDGSGVLYNSRETVLDFKKNRTTFNGEVVIIGGGTIISADSVTVDRVNRSLYASGHVILITPNEVFSGSSLHLFSSTGDIKIEDALLIGSDAARVDQAARKILGISQEELHFETNRAIRLRKIAEEKQALRDDFESEYSINPSPPPEEVVSRYALLLQQEEITTQVPNKALSKMPAAKRKAFLKRRRYWDEGRKNYKGGAGFNTYLRIEGATLSRTDGNDYNAQAAYWTTCKCDDDETPAWGFSAENIDAQSGGYLDLTDAVLEIKGIPVLYFPFLKLPLKGERQSGFLFPTLRTGDQSLGTVFTQPVYYALSDRADATLTTDFFQRRGTKLALETRYAATRDTGLRLNVEMMRDRQWLDDQFTRRRLRRDYRRKYDSEPSVRELASRLSPDPCGHLLNDSNRNADPRDPTVQKQLEDCLESEVEEPLQVPGNTWRHAKEWSGGYYLTPRLSFKTKGEVRSDHRYIEDLQLTDEFEAAFSNNQFAGNFNVAKARVNYDHYDYYIGATTAYGDNVILPDRSFTGLQIPGRVDMMSRFARIDQGISPVPVYANAEWTAIPIGEWRGSGRVFDAKPNLGSGRWQRVAVNFASPLKTEGVFTIDLFGDIESRFINHSGPGEDNARIESWSTGLAFHLPVDGIGRIPSWLDFSENQENRSLHLHHLMDWSLTLSSRPIVHRYDDYGTFFDGEDRFSGAQLTYFDSDQRVGVNQSSDVSVEDSMQTHLKATLEMDHRWKLIRKSWERLEGERPASSKSGNNYRDRALQELMYHLDPMVSDPSQMFRELSPEETTSEDKLRWHIHRYRLTSSSTGEPASLYGKISYDLAQEKRRRDEIRNNRIREINNEPVTAYSDLPEPWQGPELRLGLNYEGFVLNNTVHYNTYQRTATQVDFGLSLPRVFQTSLSFGYSLGKSLINEDGTGNSFSYKLNKDASFGLSTNLIPYISMDFSYVKKLSDPDAKNNYETRLGLSYMSTAECWGLRFLRQKGLGAEEADASYLMQLVVVFVGQTRYQDVSSSLVRKIRGEDGS